MNHSRVSRSILPWERWEMPGVMERTTSSKPGASPSASTHCRQLGQSPAHQLSIPGTKSDLPPTAQPQQSQRDPGWSW